MVSIDLIDKLEIFKAFTNDEQEKILKLCTTDKFQNGDRLFQEGDDAQDMWIVIDGEVALRFETPDAKPSTDESTLSSHRKDIPESQVMGWSCFVPPYKMRLSAYCVSRKCQVIKISRMQLNKLMETNTQIGYKIMRYMVQVVGYRFMQFQDEVARYTGIGMMNSW
ncbi:MAG: cyclic nucleotide-binding domain-containing protein [Desulfobacteraceae bacterium]|nr:cyclic nucleotide-binding domain-containing protein [Desulfobacteraceae bacterium]